MFVSAIERLVTLRRGIPSDADGKRMGWIVSALERSEIKRQAFAGVLLGRDAPSRDVGKRREAKEAFGVFQMLVAAEDLFPLTVVILRDYSP